VLLAFAATQARINPPWLSALWVHAVPFVVAARAIVRVAFHLSSSKLSVLPTASSYYNTYYLRNPLEHEIR
jgi:hypothetical protein